MLVRRGNASSRQSVDSKTFAGQVSVDRTPGRIGFMSTQRLGRLRRPAIWSGAKPAKTLSSARAMWGHLPAATGSTAATSDWVRRATNSLQSDYRFTPLFRPVFSLACKGSAPPGAALQLTARPAASGSSLPPIPAPPVCARLHLAWPWVPASASSRTERYDGKRNLHLQYAA
jgi:hypothetical protein